MKDLFKMIIIGLAAGACISAKQAPNNEEIAMARCSSNKDDRCYPGEGKRSENERSCYKNGTGIAKCDSNDRKKGECQSLDASGRKRCARPSKNRTYDVNKQKNCDDRGRCKEMTDRSGAVELRNNYKNVQPSNNIPVKKSAAQKVLEGN